MINRTKIIATIGPSSDSKPILKQMIQAGMNVARLNCSHGTHAEHAEVANIIRELSREMQRPVGILVDLQGPKIRTGTLKNGKPVILQKNGIIKITSKLVEGTAEVVSTTYKNLPNDVKKDDNILLDDGLICLKVISKTSDTVTCKVIVDGILKEHKGINLPGVKVSAPSLTEKDQKDLIFGIEIGADFFALSFVRSAADLKKIKSLIRKHGSDIPVIAKIEKPEAIQDIDAIIETTDIIMIARGDLGVELEPEDVPGMQKSIIQKSILANRPVITATQMLESMTEKPVPTRAEASDVANAIYDGTDAVMLSAETATGKYPVQAVSMMYKIAAKAEQTPFMKYDLHHEDKGELMIDHAIAQSCVNILKNINARAIISFSISGRTSMLIANRRPSRPIYSFAPYTKTYNRLSLVWGVVPLIISSLEDTQLLIEEGEKILQQKKLIKKKDIIVIATGLALRSGSTNIIKIHRVGKND